MRRYKNFYWVIILILVIGGLLGLNYYWQNKGTDKNNLPDYALRNSEVQAAYKYTLENLELLEHIPCYCNCYRLGHKSVENCFVKEFKKDDGVVFENHGANCGICYHTVLDSKSLSQEGKSPTEIRDFIENKYSKYGKGTDTPKP